MNESYPVDSTAQSQQGITHAYILKMGRIIKYLEHIIPKISLIWYHKQIFINKHNYYYDMKNETEMKKTFMRK